MRMLFDCTAYDLVWSKIPAISDDGNMKRSKRDVIGKDSTTVPHGNKLMNTYSGNQLRSFVHESSHLPCCPNEHAVHE